MKIVFFSPLLNKFWSRIRMRISLKSGIRIRIKTFWILHTVTVIFGVLYKKVKRVWQGASKHMLKSKNYLGG